MGKSKEDNLSKQQRYMTKDPEKWSKWYKDYHKEYGRAYREKNKERLKAYAHEYYKKNKERLKAARKKLRAARKKNKN